MKTAMCDHLILASIYFLNSILIDTNGDPVGCAGDSAYVCSCQITLKWSSAQAQPGEQVSLTVAGTESRFQVAIVVKGTQNDAPQPYTELLMEQVGEHFRLEKAQRSTIV